ncbi:MAG: DUF3108 domain-containing protein [Gammaproteobacteria bacterium]
MIKARSIIAFVTQLLAVTVLATGATVSAADFEPHSAHYDVRIKMFKGSMVTGLQAEKGVFTGTSEIRARGLARLAAKGTIENRSQFRLSNDAVQPLAFEGNDSISKRKKKATLDFDWEALRVTGLTSQKNSGELVENQVNDPVEDGTHDAVSLQYALMHDLQKDQLRDQYILIDGSERKVINITRREPVTLRVPFGEFEAVPVEHQVEGSSRTTIFWLAEELNFLPVKIEQRRKGKRLMKAELGDYRPTEELSSL